MNKQQEQKKGYIYNVRSWYDTINVRFQLSIFNNTVLEYIQNLLKITKRAQNVFVRDNMQINSLTILMKDALLKGDVKLFADLLHESWILKKKMNNLNKYIF